MHGSPRQLTLRAITAGALLAGVLFASQATAEERYAERSAELFRVARAERTLSVGVARIFHRATNATGYSRGLEFRLAEGLLWNNPPFVVESSSGASFRTLDDGYALSLLQSGGLAGLKWTVLSVKAGVNLAFVNVDVLDGRWDAAALWPRSQCVAAVDVGPLRFEAQLYVEYFWRWFGADQLVRGMGINVAFKRPGSWGAWQKAHDHVRQKRDRRAR